MVYSLAQPLMTVAVVGFPLLTAASLLLTLSRARRIHRACAEREARMLNEVCALAAVLRCRTADEAPAPMRSDVGRRAAELHPGAVVADSYCAYQARRLERSATSGR